MFGVFVSFFLQEGVGREPQHHKAEEYCPLKKKQKFTKKTNSHDWPIHFCMVGSMAHKEWEASKAPSGKLPPFEVAKAIAYKHTIEAMEKHLGKSCWQFLGTGKADFTAQQLTVAGEDGKPPSVRAIKKWWAKDDHDQAWQPAKRFKNMGGAPVQITDQQKKTIAQKAMALKKALVAPTPEKIRSSLPRVATNRKTQEPISDEHIRRIFKSMCYDEKEDDPWHYLLSIQQDCLAEEVKPARVKTADAVLRKVTPTAAWNFVAIDPCFSMLPKHQEKADLMKIAAMGHKKWMSPKSKRKGPNPRAPKTAKTQKEDVTVVPWTPMFTRGKVRLVVFTEPKKYLANSEAVASFVKDVLPGVVDGMKKEFGWSNVPRVLLHDKATYFVNVQRNIMNKQFAAGLKKGGFSSWVDIVGNGDTKWMARLLGDYYPHETLISHVRRLSSGKFARKNCLNETPTQFASRMAKIEHYLNYEMGGGSSLEKLGKQLLDRSEKLKASKGERLPK